MKITKVKVVKMFETEGVGVRGIVEVTLDDCFVVENIRIVQKPDKMIVAMPSKSKKFVNSETNMEEEKYRDLAHPINQECREMFNTCCLGAFERATEEGYEERFDE